MGRVGAGWVASIGRLWGVCLCTDVRSNPHFSFLFCCLFSSWIIPVSGLQHVFNLLHSKYTKHQKLIQAGYHMNSFWILVSIIQCGSICYTHFFLYIFSHHYTAAPLESTDSFIRQLWNISLRTNLVRNPIITKFKGSKCFSGLCGGPLSRVHAKHIVSSVPAKSLFRLSFSTVNCVIKAKKQSWRMFMGFPTFS